MWTLVKVFGHKYPENEREDLRKRVYRDSAATGSYVGRMSLVDVLGEKNRKEQIALLEEGIKQVAQDSVAHSGIEKRLKNLRENQEK